MNKDTVSDECFSGFHSQCSWSSCACLCHLRLEEDDRLDHSEIDFIRRVILAAGKNPDDPDTMTEYETAYIGIRRSIRFFDCPVPAQRM